MAGTAAALLAVLVLVVLVASAGAAALTPAVALAAGALDACAELPAAWAAMPTKIALEKSTLPTAVA